ncbi:helix-turn-helix domain-containing protein [Streptomyces tanashiensis]
MDGDERTIAEPLRSEVVRERRGALRQRVHSAGIRLQDILCCEDRRGFVGPGYADEYSVVLVRAGSFVQRIEGEELFLDPTGGYLLRPGDELRVAHPSGPGDRSSELRLSEKAFADRFDGLAGVSRGFHVDGVTDLRHRALLSAARRGAEPFELAEHLHRLLDAVAASVDSRRAEDRGPARQATARVHAGLVRDVCAVLATGPVALGLTLEELAQVVGVSPHHLSRVFHAVTGRTLTRYRNELRLRGVLHAIEGGAGAGGLRALAYEYGFADQAHLTRMCRSHTGHVPSAVRRLLADRA